MHLTTLAGCLLSENGACLCLLGLKQSFMCLWQPCSAGFTISDRPAPFSSLVRSRRRGESQDGGGIKPQPKIYSTITVAAPSPAVHLMTGDWLLWCPCSYPHVTCGASCCPLAVLRLWPLEPEENMRRFPGLATNTGNHTFTAPSDCCRSPYHHDGWRGRRGERWHLPSRRLSMRSEPLDQR